MWCESSWASEALQIGRGGSRGRRPPQLLFPFSFLRDCWLHFLQASLQDTFVCFFTPLVFCSFSFLWLTCSSPGCLFLSACLVLCLFLWLLLTVVFYLSFPTPSRCHDLTAFHLNLPNLSRLPEQDTLSHRHIYHEVPTLYNIFDWFIDDF